MVRWEDLDYFERSEFSAPDMMSAVLLDKLDRARHIAGVPFRINSDFRAGNKGAHGKGLAVDIACASARARFLMVKALLFVGFRRVGVYARHVHVDVDCLKDQDVMWYGRYEVSPGKEV